MKNWLIKRNNKENLYFRTFYKSKRYDNYARDLRIMYFHDRDYLKALKKLVEGSKKATIEKMTEREYRTFRWRKFIYSVTDKLERKISRNKKREKEKKMFDILYKMKTVKNKKDEYPSRDKAYKYMKEFLVEEFKDFLEK